MNKRGWRLPLRKIWNVLTSGLLALLVIGFVLLVNISGHIEGYSQAEIDYAASSQSLGSIMDNPVYAPHKTLTWAIDKIVDPAPLAARIASAAIGVVSILLFYGALRMWHGKRVGFLAAVLFGSSSWLLLTVRSGDPYSAAALSVLLVFMSGYLMSLHYKNIWSYLAVIVTLSLVVYMPGMVWLLLIGLVLRGKKLLKALSVLSTRERVVLGSAISLLVVLPIAYAAIRDWHILGALIGLPQQWPSIQEALTNLGNVFVQLSITQPHQMQWSVGSMPLLDMAISALVPIGIAYYWRRRSLDRTKLLLASGVLALLMIALGLDAGYAYLLPLIFILAGGGLAFVLLEWLEVFPRNVLARAVGIICVSAVVAMSVFYNLSAYYRAVPHTDNIRSIYNVRL